MGENDAGRGGREDETQGTGEADEGASPGITGASSGGPTTGISVSGSAGRLPARGEPAGTAEATAEDDLPAGPGQPGPRGPESPAAADVTVTDTVASSPGVIAARERIVEQEQASSRRDTGTVDAGSEP